MARAATERVLERFDEKSKIITLPHAPKLHIREDYRQSRIRFNNVSFHYPETDIAAIDGVSFGVQSGTMVALVGHSGGGKSTILNLIERFYDVDQGEILIDGQDIRRISLPSLRENISLVLQDVFLFDKTVMANIAYAKDDASEADVIRAAKIADAHAFIKKLPQGYDTIIGENGMNLSGGQCQRIAFARALLRDSPILLLDEPTSSLDTQSELAIQKSMAKLMKGRTVLIIAHRLSTIQSADKILVMDKGSIVESGTHDGLLKKGGAYKALYEAQFALAGA